MKAAAGLSMPPVPGFSDPAVDPGTEEASLVAVAAPAAPGTVGPSTPVLPLGFAIPPVPDVPPVLPPPFGRLGTCTPLEPPLLLDPPPPLLPELPPVGSGNFGTEGTGTEPPPLLLELEPDVAVGAGTTDPTDFLTHWPVLLTICPTGQSVAPAAAPAVKAPPRESASALAVTIPARRWDVLGDMRVKPPRPSGGFIVLWRNEYLPSW